MKSCLPFEQRNEDLAARFAGQRGIIIDEASKMLIPKKYMEGHTETMMEMFDAPRRLERELRGDGKLIVYNPALALIGATTPARLGRYITDSEWEDGLMARFLCLTPTEREIKCVLNGQDLDSHDFPADLKARLLRIYNAFPMPPDEAALHSLDEPMRHPAVSALMDQGVFDLFNAYYAALHDMTDPRRNLDERLRGQLWTFLDDGAQTGADPGHYGLGGQWRAGSTAHHRCPLGTRTDAGRGLSRLGTSTDSKNSASAWTSRTRRSYWISSPAAASVRLQHGTSCVEQASKRARKSMRRWQRCWMMA